MTEKQKKYGLIGKVLTHSFSQSYFTQKFENENINAQYENIELAAIEDVRNYLTDQYQGFNVTMPYKEAIIPFLDGLSEEAKEIGAVNTIKIIDGQSFGFNTDVFGFQQMIKPFFESQHERALIIGTGGAAKAVAFVLENIGVTPIYLSRNPKGSTEFGYEDLNENMIRFNKIIVNTTPLGQFPMVDDCVKIPFEAISEQHLVVDLIYNPKETLFLKNAKAHGAKVLNGLTMLHQQAEKAWEIWNK